MLLAAHTGSLALEGWRYQEAAQDSERWYAVYTRSKFEKKVSAELTEKSVDHYLPLSNELHQWKDRKKMVELPIFPNYLFARFVDSSSVRLRILQTAGVVRILGLEVNAEPVPDAQIEAIRRMLASKRPCYCQPFLQEGSRVRVRRGPLKDLEGSLLRIKNQLRLVVSISLLSQSVSTEIDIRDVEPISAEHR